jgi:hypothetical protein
MSRSLDAVSAVRAAQSGQAADAVPNQLVYIFWTRWFGLIWIRQDN